MRPRLRLRKTRSVHVAIATIMLAVPASAFALSGAVANSNPGSTDAAAPAFELQARIAPQSLPLGSAVTASGTAPASEAGHWAVLQTAAKRNARWRPVTATRITRAGRFSLRARLPHSGFVRVVDAATQGGAAATAASWSTSPAGAVATAPRPVRVTARFSVDHPSFDALGGQRLAVRGRLMPWRAGREVRLVGHSGRRGWQTLARTRTRTAGRFTLRFAADSGVNRRLRVVFDGDRANRGLSASAGTLTVYSDQSVASWYDDARRHRVRLSRRARRRQQVAAVRHQGALPLRRPQRHRDGRRPWAVRGRTNLGFQPERRGGARLRRSGHRLGDQVGVRRAATSDCSPSLPQRCRIAVSLISTWTPSTSPSSCDGDRSCGGYR